MNTRCASPAETQVTRTFLIELYYGYAWGKAVITSIYPAGPQRPICLHRDELAFLRLWDRDRKRCGGG